MESKATNQKNEYDSNGYLTGIQILDKKQLASALQNYSALEEKFGK